MDYSGAYGTSTSQPTPPGGDPSFLADGMAPGAAAAYLHRLQNARVRRSGVLAAFPIGAPRPRDQVVPYWFDGGK